MSAPSGITTSVSSKTSTTITWNVKCTDSGTSSTAVTFYVYGYFGTTTDKTLLTTLMATATGTAGSSKYITISKYGTENLQGGEVYSIKLVVENSSGETAESGLSQIWMVPEAATITTTAVTSTTYSADYFIKAYEGPMYNIEYRWRKPGDSSYTTFKTVTTNYSYSGSLPTVSSLTPNTQYYVYSQSRIRYTSTGAQTTSTAKFFNFTTLPVAPSVNISGYGTGFASFVYSCPADGGSRQKNIQYSLDNGTTWTTVETVSGGAAKSGTFTINNLQDFTVYTLLVRAHTTAGDSESTALTFYTKPSTQVFYGPIPSTISLSYSNYSDPDNVGVTIDDVDELLAAIQAVVPADELTDVEELTLTVEEI